MSNAEIESIGRRIKKLRGTQYYSFLVTGLRTAVEFKRKDDRKHELATLNRIEECLKFTDGHPLGKTDQVAQYVKFLSTK